MKIPLANFYYFFKETLCRNTFVPSPKMKRTYKFSMSNNNAMSLTKNLISSKSFSTFGTNTATSQKRLENLCLIKHIIKISFLNIF